MSLAIRCSSCGAENIVDQGSSSAAAICRVCRKTLIAPADDMPNKIPNQAQKSNLPVTELIVGGIVILPIALAVVLPLLTPAVGGRSTVKQNECGKRMHQILVAMHKYHARENTFPPAYIADDDGRPMHSWRVLLLPYLDKSELFAEFRFDEPWNSPHNLRVAERMPDVYRCPSDESMPSYHTSYMVIAGPGALFDGSRGISLSAVSDGAATTIALVEVTGRSVFWTDPTDLDATQIKFVRGTNGFGGKHPGGVWLGFADSSLRLFGMNEIDDAQFKSMITIAGGEPPIE